MGLLNRAKESGVTLDCPEDLSPAEVFEYLLGAARVSDTDQNASTPPLTEPPSHYESVVNPTPMSQSSSTCYSIPASGSGSLPRQGQGCLPHSGSGSQVGAASSTRLCPPPAPAPFASPTRSNSAPAAGGTNPFAAENIGAVLEVNSLKQSVNVLTAWIRMLQQQVAQQQQGKEAERILKGRPANRLSSSTMAWTESGEEIEDVDSSRATLPGRQVSARMREVDPTQLELAQYRQAFAALHSRVGVLEAENRRLQQEMALSKVQAKSKVLLREALRRESEDSYTPRVAASSSRPRGFRQSLGNTSGTGTPPVQRPASKSPWVTRSQSVYIPASSSLRAPCRETHSLTTDPGSAGRRTPGICAGVGSFTPNTGAGPVPVSRQSRDRSPSRGVLRGLRDQVNGPEPGARGTSPRRTALPQLALSPPQRASSPRAGSRSPGRTRSQSPRADVVPVGGRLDKDLPMGWQRLVAEKYCEVSARPIVDRVVCLEAATAAARKRCALCGPVAWLRARVRWADLLITERGRVPYRGEDVVHVLLTSDLFPHVHQDRSSPPSPASPGGGWWPESPRQPGGPHRWVVSEFRILKTFSTGADYYHSTLKADAAAALLHLAWEPSTPSKENVAPLILVRPPPPGQRQEPLAPVVSGTPLMSSSPGSSVLYRGSLAPSPALQRSPGTPILPQAFVASSACLQRNL